VSGDWPDEIVLVTRAPNVPFAELIVSDLKAHGIGAFYKSAAMYGMTSVTGPANPCDIYVEHADAERARNLLLPDDGASGADFAG
jgi:hypothetical protein